MSGHTTSSPPELLQTRTKAALAKRFGVSPQSIERIARKHRVPTYRPSRRGLLLYDLAAFEEAMRASLVEVMSGADGEA